MAFSNFTHRPDSNWNDILREKYPFPRHYLKPVMRCLGDWIIYREPHSKNKASRGYFAVAKVQKIIPDPDLQYQKVYFAIIEPGTYEEFDNPVPFRDDKRDLVERGLLTDKGKVSGIVKEAVRPLHPEDFARIIGRGLGFDMDMNAPAILPDGPQISLSPKNRNRQVIHRVARSALFRETVMRAYDKRCAITGLRLINGGGRAEVEAAHIRPVADDGPDIIGNGIALSRTVHWMFDRGLIGLEDDLTIMVSRQSNNPDNIRSMINESGTLLKPEQSSDHPRTEYVTWHRENCFKH